MKQNYHFMLKHLFLRFVDVILGVVTGLTLIVYMLAKSMIGEKSRLLRKNILLLDTSYTLEMVRKRQLQQAVISRDLNGYFEHVWSVHLCATVIPPKDIEETFGEIIITSFAPRHTIIEGKKGRFRALKKMPLTNFILAQWNICLYLFKLIKNQNISVIRAGDPYYQGLIGLCLAKGSGIPCVFRMPINYDLLYHMSGDVAWPGLFRKRWIEKLIEHYTLRKADLVAGGNQDGLNFVLNNGARKEYTTIFRIGNLIHRVHFQPPDRRPMAKYALQELGLSNKIFSITISRLEKLKQIDDVLRVLAEVRKSEMNISALIVGDGRMKNDLVNMAESLGIADNVIFAGNRNQEWIASVLPYASVVISPFMGRALTEAALSGVPVVAYDIEWQSEVIKTGETGELVKYRDWKAMAASVVKLLSDRRYARRMGENARCFTLEMMDPVKLNQHERNEYDKLFERYFSN